MMTNQAVLEAFLNMKLRPVDAPAQDVPAIREVICQQIAHFPAFALPSVHDPVVICGFVTVFGTCTVWMLTGEGFEERAGKVLGMQRRLCADMFSALGCHRMDAEIIADRPEAARWIERLGFEFEAVKRRANYDGKDQLVYVWPTERGAAWAE